MTENKWDPRSIHPSTPATRQAVARIESYTQSPYMGRARYYDVGAPCEVHMGRARYYDVGAQCGVPQILGFRPR